MLSATATATMILVLISCLVCQAQSQLVDLLQTGDTDPEVCSNKAWDSSHDSGNCID